MMALLDWVYGPQRESDPYYLLLHDFVVLMPWWYPLFWAVLIGGIVSWRGARCVRESRFTRVSDGALLLSARTTWAYVDAKSHRPRRIDQRVLEAMPVG